MSEYDAAQLASGADGTSLAASYVSKLPRGLGSYPGCMAKASLVNAFLASKPIHSEGVPATLQALLNRPPRTNTWVPEVHFLTLALLIREQHFTADEPFLAWVRAVNTQLFRGPIYRALMLVASTRMLAAGTPLRWRQFHQDTELTANHGEGGSVDLRFHYEPNLFGLLHVRMFLASLEAAITAVSGSASRTVSVEVMEHAVLVWLSASVIHDCEDVLPWDDLNRGHGEGRCFTRRRRCAGVTARDGGIATRLLCEVRPWRSCLAR